jgi:FAD/FMN-containing dehydrogenase
MTSMTTTQLPEDAGGRPGDTAEVAAARDRLAATIRGDVIDAGHDDYDAVRAVYNRMIDRRPALIVRCVDDADVIDALVVAREAGLPLAVRGGGHSAPGYAVVDDGLVIDLSAMRHVLVDPVAGRAIVGGGATWGDVDHATSPFGLAVPGGVVSTTGVAGLTLGGGSGHLTRPYGLSCDSLISATVVTADGRLVRASEDSHPELFWALRGGGGNFGVVTSFEFALHPAGTVLSAVIVYDIAAAAEVMRCFDDHMRTAPDQLGAVLAFGLGPPVPFLPPQHHDRPVVLVIACWPGAEEEGRAALRPLLEHAAVRGADVAPVPFAALNSAFDADAPPGLYNYYRGHFVTDLTDEIIEVHTTYGPHVPNATSAVHLYAIDGVAGRVAADATAFSHRDARYSTGLAAIWADPADSDANIAWVREYWQALDAVAPNGGYVNFMSFDEGEAAVRATYGPNYERLAAIKTAYDANNLFRLNQNIKPA